MIFSILSEPGNFRKLEAWGNEHEFFEYDEKKTDVSSNFPRIQLVDSEPKLATILIDSEEEMAKILGKVCSL